MSVASWASRHARSILFLLVALVAGGAMGAWALPVSLFPHIDFPRIRVDVDAGERPAERMEAEVTRPLEAALFDRDERIRESGRAYKRNGAPGPSSVRSHLTDFGSLANTDFPRLAQRRGAFGTAPSSRT